MGSFEGRQGTHGSDRDGRAHFEHEVLFLPFEAVLDLHDEAVVDPDRRRRAGQGRRPDGVVVGDATHARVRPLVAALEARERLREERAALKRERRERPATQVWLFQQVLGRFSDRRCPRVL